MNKVIIAGSINQDVVVSTKRHPQIGETVFGADLKYFPGGKGANQAVASAKFGAQTIMLGKVGDDVSGKQLINFLNQQNIETNILIEPGMPTGTAIITVSEETANNTIVIIPGANLAFTAQDFDNIKFEPGDVLISQFEISVDTIEAFFRKGREAGTTNIFNPAPAQTIPKKLFDLIDIIILNETELSFISGILVDAADESIKKAVYKIKNQNLIIIVTLGERGAVAFNNEEIIKIPGRQVQAVDTTGAGDCFVGVLAAGLATGKDFVESINLANCAAAISVTREGAGSSLPDRDEVISQIS